MSAWKRVSPADFPTILGFLRSHLQLSVRLLVSVFGARRTKFLLSFLFFVVVGGIAVAADHSRQGETWIASAALGFIAILVSLWTLATADRVSQDAAS